MHEEPFVNNVTSFSSFLNPTFNFLLLSITIFEPSHLQNNYVFWHVFGHVPQFTDLWASRSFCNSLRMAIHVWIQFFTHFVYPQASMDYGHPLILFFFCLFDRSLGIYHTSLLSVHFSQLLAYCTSCVNPIQYASTPLPSLKIPTLSMNCPLH